MFLAAVIIIGVALFVELFLAAKAVSETSHDIGKFYSSTKSKVPLGKLKHLLK